MLSILYLMQTFVCSHLTSAPWYRNRSAPSLDVRCLDIPAPNGNLPLGISSSAISSKVLCIDGFEEVAWTDSTDGSTVLRLAKVAANRPSSNRICPFTIALLCACSICCTMRCTRPGDLPRRFSLTGKSGSLVGLPLRDRLRVSTGSASLVSP